MKLNYYGVKIAFLQSFYVKARKQLVTMNKLIPIITKANVEIGLIL